MQATTDKPTLAWEEEDVREWAGKGDVADKSLAISYAMAAAEAHPDDRDRQKALAWLAANDLTSYFQQTDPPTGEQGEGMARPEQRTRLCGVNAAYATLGTTIAEWKHGSVETRLDD